MFKTLAVILFYFMGNFESSVEKNWIDNFNEDPNNFSSTGSNTYFLLKPGFQLVL